MDLTKLRIFMYSDKLLNRALKKEFLSSAEGQYLYHNATTSELMWVADKIRKETVPNNIVTWQIDRNVNTTNA